MAIDVRTARAYACRGGACGATPLVDLRRSDEGGERVLGRAGGQWRCRTSRANQGDENLEEVSLRRVLESSVCFRLPTLPHPTPMCLLRESLNDVLGATKIWVRNPAPDSPPSTGVDEVLGVPTVRTLMG